MLCRKNDTETLKIIRFSLDGINKLKCLVYNNGGFLYVCILRDINSMVSMVSMDMGGSPPIHVVSLSGTYSILNILLDLRLFRPWLFRY